MKNIFMKRLIFYKVPFLGDLKWVILASIITQYLKWVILVISITGRPSLGQYQCGEHFFLNKITFLTNASFREI
jgi:hypothetical protein